MKVAILGYGKEGKAAEKYFLEHGEAVEVFDNFTSEDLNKIDFSEYDLVLRSPSVHPREGFSSMTKYFFEKCPAPIIGVTGTKGKGTTCSLITEILRALGKKVYLVGNIGNPAIDVLDGLTPEDVVVYEMSSFQLWDLTVSPEVAVVLRVEADHLNVHDGFDDYVGAKGNIAKYQTTSDTLVYFKNNKWSVKIAEKSPAAKLAYPIEPLPVKIRELLDKLGVPGEHNKENAEAALLAVSGLVKMPAEMIVEENYDALARVFRDFKGLPHHIEFVRNLNGVDYYDDSFSASYPSLEVAVKAFEDRPVVLIAGGKDRGLDLGPEKKAIFGAPNLAKAMLIGETRQKLADGEPVEKYLLVNTLEKAVILARGEAEQIAKSGKRVRPVVLLSPGAASFDMFRDFYDRGEQFKRIVEGMK
ncbi:UDP-N-acetylmuramoyl-L-alanine--D-glutamate ligase [Candidatus Saccharibacteria bacterium]|nr:UDP-N-acetylmuramoyl-L-alanine--D-glutamate ligase [Candidatus Saccharibacteria bacterium]